MESDLNLYLDCILNPTSKESQRRSLCALADLLSTNGKDLLFNIWLNYNVYFDFHQFNALLLVGEGPFT